MQLHTSQILLADKLHRYASWSSNVIFASAVGLCISTLLPSHIASKIGNTAIASGLFFVAGKLESLSEFADDYRGQVHSASLKVHGQFIESAIAKSDYQFPQAGNVAAQIAIADIKQALSKPHILVLGETGSGKSTLVKFLVAHATAPAIVLDSHAAPDDWEGMNVIGMGRDYQSIGQAVSQLVKLMNNRYQARSQGQKQFEPLLVLIDEFPAAAANLGKAFTDDIMLLVREARKVSIRLIILSQGSEVKTLGIEGQGSIRECFAMVSLGKFATDRAKSLKDDRVKEFIASAQFPAMLDDFPCELPKIDQVKLPSLPMPSDYKQLLTAAIEPIDSPNNQPSAPSAFILPISAPSTHNQQSANLSAPLLAIVDYAKRKDEFISARQVQSGIAIFKSAKATEIREYFKYLATLGYGVTRGGDDALEFSVS